MSARQNNLEGYLGAWNALDKGCKGDGVTDDAATLTNILAAAGSTLVILPPATYKLGSAVTVPANGACWILPGVTLSGSGTLTATSGGLLIDQRAGTFVVSGIPLNASSGLSFSGSINATGGSVPTATAGANAGTTPPAPVVTAGSNSIRGSLTFGTGTTPAAGAQAVVTFAAALGSVPAYVAILGKNAGSVALNLYPSSITAAGFTVSTGNAPSASQANTVYSVEYLVIL